MNQTNPTIHPSTVPWPTSDAHHHSTDTAALHDNESNQPAAAVLVMNAGQSDDHTVARTTDGAVQAMQPLHDRASATDKNMHEKVLPPSEAQAEWAGGVRTTVRRHPMVSVAAAFAMGALIVRMAR